MLRVSSLIYLQQVWERQPSEDNNKNVIKAISTDTSTTAAIQSFPSPPQTPIINTATDAAPLLSSPTHVGATDVQQQPSSSASAGGNLSSQTKDTTMTLSKVNINNDGRSADHKIKERENDGIVMEGSNGSQDQTRQQAKDECNNSKPTATAMGTNDDVISTSSPTEGDSGVGASAGRTMGSYHFYYDNDQEEEAEGDNIVSMASNSSGGTTSMPPTPTSLPAQKQHQHHLPPPPPPPEEPAEEQKGLRRQASRLTLKRRSLTKKLKKAVSFHKLGNKRDSVVM